MSEQSAPGNFASTQSAGESFERFGGPSRHLCGIFHHGRRGREDKRERVAVLLWNVGVFHRTGPNRQYVELARLLARHGLDVLRFDLGGLGDSSQSDTTSVGQAKEVEDIRAAIDHVEAAHGCRRVILIGFCSSAINAHPCAVVDERVAGLVMIDGYGYKTAKFAAVHVLRRCFSTLHWRHILRKSFARLGRARTDAVAVPSYFREFPPRENVMSELQRLLARGVRCLFVYTGGLPTVYNYKNQFFDMFPMLPRHDSRLAVEFFPEANHLFAALPVKEQYQATICRWILDSFAGGAAPTLKALR